MILGDRETAWTVDVAAMARHAGWTVYVQDAHNQRQAMPSVVLMRGGRMLLVYLRTTVRRNRRPAAAVMAQLVGVDAVIWTPADRQTIAAILQLPDSGTVRTITSNS